MATAPITRVLPRIDITEPGCWIWPGSHLKNGYGTVMAGPPFVEYYRPLLVHRVTYEYFIGDIPEGFELDHLCRVRLCCNPVHVEPVTRLVNVQRGNKYRPEKCPHDHPYTPENTFFTKKGHIRCRECDRANSRRFREHRAWQRAS